MSVIFKILIMPFTITPNHESRLIIYHHSGKIPEEELDAAWSQLMTMEEFTTQKYDLLSDYSASSFSFSMEKAYEILEFFKQIKPVIDGKKQAIVVSDPIATAGSQLLEINAMQVSGFKIRVFSTVKAAMAWLR